MEATEGLFTGRFNALSEPTLVVNIIFILRAGSRRQGAGIVNNLDGSCSRARRCILRGWSKRVGLYGGETNKCGTNEAGTLDDEEETGG